MTSGQHCGATYLQEALGVLQQVEAAVAAVVLLGDPAAGALHGVGGEEAGSPPPHLPLHLQVAADTTPGFKWVSECDATNFGGGLKADSLSQEPAHVLAE